MTSFAYKSDLYGYTVKEIILYRLKCNIKKMKDLLKQINKQTSYSDQPVGETGGGCNTLNFLKLKQE